MAGGALGRHVDQVGLLAAQPDPAPGEEAGEQLVDPVERELVAEPQLPVDRRAAKVAGIAASIPELEVDDPSGEARVLVLGWGSTYGPIAAAVRTVRASGALVARAHLRHLNPMPANTGEVLKAYDRVIVPEMNLGQLAMLLRAEHLVDVRSHTAVRGLPFTTVELADVIVRALEELSSTPRSSPLLRRSDTSRGPRS